MTIYNTGIIVANKPFDDDAKDVISDELRFVDDSYVDGNEIILSGYQSQIDSNILNVIDKISEMGYVLNGEITYSGDCNGKVYVKDNDVESYDISESSIIDADDETLVDLLGIDRLIRIVVSQGYNVENRTSCEEK